MHCNKNAHYKCPTCQNAWYCTKTCYEQHYDIHRPICEDSVQHQARKYTMFTDVAYDTCLSFLRSGASIASADRNLRRVLHGVILRRDDELYETPTCMKILPYTTLRLFTETIITNNYKTLVKLCGKPTMEQMGHAVFYCGKRHRLYMLRIKDDVLTIVEEVPKLHALYLSEDEGVVKCNYH